MITSASLSNLVEPAILRVMDMDRPVALQANLKRTKFFTVLPSETATEEVIGLGNISPDAWRTYRKTGKVGQAQLLEDYKTTFTHIDYPLDIVIPLNLVNDGKEGLLDMFLMKTRNSMERLMEEDAGSVFVNAFDATNYPIADGVALCSNSHPLSPADATNVQDNLETTAFSYAAFKSDRTRMKKFTDHNSRRMFLMPNLVLGPVDLEDTFTEVRTAVGKPGSADNDGNAASATVFETWHALTDANDWFTIDSMAMKESLLWFNRGVAGPILTDLDTLYATYQINVRYSFGAVDWRWVLGHQVS